MRAAEIILPLVSIILLIIFAVYIAYLLINSKFNRASTPGSTRTNNPYAVPNGVITCPVGECATDLISGFKRCPTETEAITTNPGEVCNPRFLCTSPITPFALQSDGSTNISGVCEANTICSCLRTPQCPEYVSTIFTTSNGDPYTDIDTQRLTFPQQASYETEAGTRVDTGSIKFQNPASAFCAIPRDWLSRTTPGCNFGANLACEELKVCFGLPNNCNGVLGNPCKQGNLAILSEDPNNFTFDQIDNVQFACISGTDCPCGDFAFFNLNTGEVVCKAITC